VALARYPARREGLIRTISPFAPIKSSTAFVAPPCGTVVLS
jgi:hypothetical protein